MSEALSLVSRNIKKGSSCYDAAEIGMLLVEKNCGREQ